MVRALLPMMLLSALTACDVRATHLGSLSDSGGGTGGGAGGGGGAPPDAGSDGGTCSKRSIKLLLLLDQSGSMCLTDPPGSQQAAGFCQMITPPTGVTEPARVRALKKWLSNLGAQPGVSVSLAPFETNVQNPYPAAGATRFVQPTDPGLLARVSSLQSSLGRGTDYEGVLDYAVTVISDDVAAQKTTDAGIAALAGTRYVVMLISDGTPFPRCSANDALATYADSTMPSGIWPDSPGTGDFCNATDAGPSMITGFVPGTDRNQNSALFAKVDQLFALTSQGAGGVSFNTQLLFNAQRVSACGPICQDLYGTHPEVAAALYPQAALSIARWTLTQLAQRGGGVYAESLDDFGIATLPTTLPAFVLDPTCP